MSLPRRLDRLDRAERHVVVGGDDHIRRLGEPGEPRLGHREALVAGEIGGLLEHERVLLGVLVEHVVDAGVAVDRRARAGLALEVQHLRAVREQRHDQLPLRLAALDVVGADMSQDAVDVVDPAVDRDDRDAGLDRLLERRRHRVDLVRADDDAVDALDDRGLDVGGLLGRAALAVDLHQRDLAERLGLGAQFLLHVDEERERHVGQGRQDRQRLVRGRDRAGQAGERERGAAGGA